MRETSKMKFNKSEAEYNMKSIRFLLLTITSMFIIIAGLMIVLGFSVYSHYHTFSFFYESARGGRFFTPSILCILLGMFLLIVTLFGFFGSFKLSTCMVNLYALILTIMLILKVVVVVLTFTLDTETLKNFIYIPISQYVSDAEIEMEIDRLQVSLNCCGSNSYLDYVGMEFTSNHSTVAISTIINNNPTTIILPKTCCTTQGDEFCISMRSNGCKAALINVFVQNSSVIGVLGVSVMFIQLLGIIFALLLARCIRKVKSERGLTSWRIKEQMILARENNEAQKQHGATENSVYIAPNQSSLA